MTRWSTFSYPFNHISYGDGGLWYGGYTAPRNEIKKFDPAKGVIRRFIEMPEWYSSCRIVDQSFDETTGQLWALTYQHDYEVSGANNCQIHLLEVGTLSLLSESSDSGAVATAGSQDVNVVLDARDLTSGIHSASVAIDSDGGAMTKAYVFVVHAPGVNEAPTAGAGLDQAIDATAPTMPVTLDGSGSSDPNGDELVYTWTEGATELATGVNPTINLAPGTHDITLTVDDYRGGTDTDVVRINLRAPNIEVADLYVAYAVGGGIATGTVTVRNTGDKTLSWT